MNQPSLAPPFQRALGAAHTLLIAASLLGGTAFFAWWVNRFYPLEHWLFFRYLVIWLECILFATACITAGWRALHLCATNLTDTDIAERLALAGALGVLIFFYGTFVAGVLHLYGRGYFFAWPALMLAYGLPRFGPDLFQRYRDNFALSVRAIAPRSWIQAAAAVLIIVGLLGLYLQILNPNQVGYDARWYHMPIAEFYVAAGGIEPFKEGWYLGTYPQLANLLYLWAFEAPGTLFDHVLLCTHLEYVLFAATLFGIGVLAARLLRQPRLPYAAAAVFLFPQVFAYDSNLNGGADHVLAFWAPAVGITLVRLGSRFVAREAILAGLMMAGALLTKYQAAYLFVAAFALVLVLLVRTRKWRVAAGYCGVTLLASAPHWAKNLVYYRDPFYPLLHDWMPLRPFHAGAAALMKEVYWPKLFALEGNFWEKLFATLQALVNFSFVPHDWPEFHGAKPIFGSLFTLMLPMLLLMRTTVRLLLLVIGVHVGLATWFVLGHEDRFLQGLLPWMAACTAAIIALAWSRGWLVRVALSAIVLFQWAWGLDVYFIRSHNMLGDSSIHSTTEFLGAAHRGEYKAAQSLAPTQEKIASVLPKHARVLFHRDRLRLGLAHQFLEDTPGWQGAIEYLQTDSSAGTERLWRSLGVTHVMWVPRKDGLPLADVAREIVFARAISDYVQEQHSIDGWHVGELRPRPIHSDMAQLPTSIAWLACDSDLRPGIYTPKGLAAAEPKPERIVSINDDNVLQDLDSANVIVTRPYCAFSHPITRLIDTSFDQTASISGFAIFTRQRTDDSSQAPPSALVSACGVN